MNFNDSKNSLENGPTILPPEDANELFDKLFLLKDSFDKNRIEGGQISSGQMKGRVPIPIEILVE